MDHLDLRRLRYFVAVAEELNFGRAAALLGIAQPSLSRAIQRLEAQLGVLLLERTTRHVALTAAGQTLLQQARTVLTASAAATRRTQRAGRSDSTLRVAVKPSGTVATLQTLMHAYHAAHPMLPGAQVTVCGYGEPAILLREGRADVALLRLPFDESGLDYDTLVTEPRMAIVAAGHRMARQGPVRRADLADEPVPRWPATDPTTAAYWAGVDHQHRDRYPPPAGPTVSDMAQLLEVVALGQAVAFLPASSATRHSDDHIVPVPVLDLSPSTVVVAWPHDCRSPAVAAFVHTACDLANRYPTDVATLA